jgi:hydroxyethylthiazole kinase-like sugar kinase family protein
MPEVYVHAIEGRTKEQKRALIKDITDAVVKNFAAETLSPMGVTSPACQLWFPTWQYSGS